MDINYTNFVRATCALGIVLYHFACHTSGTLFPFRYANGDIGDVIVTCFFILSGFCLYNKYKQVNDLKTFYYKRWHSIFPKFYILWGILYFINVYKKGSFLYNGSVEKLLYTVFGIDGYLLYLEKNYYIIGEWFLGAIILLYLFYPLLVKVINFSVFSLVLISLLIYVCPIYFFTSPYWGMIYFRSFGSCLISFCVGMVCNKVVDKFDNFIYVYFIFFFVLSFVELSLFNDIQLISHVLGFILFCILCYIGKKTSSNSIIKLYSDISYEIFLIQHIVIIKLLELVKPVDVFEYIICVFICIAVISVVAYLYARLTNLLL